MKPRKVKLAHTGTVQGTRVQNVADVNADLGDDDEALVQRVPARAARAAAVLEDSDEDAGPSTSAPKLPAKRKRKQKVAVVSDDEVRTLECVRLVRAYTQHVAACLLLAAAPLQLGGHCYVCRGHALFFPRRGLRSMARGGSLERWKAPG